MRRPSVPLSDGATGSWSGGRRVTSMRTPWCWRPGPGSARWPPPTACAPGSMAVVATVSRSHAAVPFTAPAYFPTARVAVTPQGDRVRLAGIMEFGSPDAAPRQQRIKSIVDSVRPFLEGVDWAARSDDWMGARPLTPDGLPLVGRDAYAGNVRRRWPRDVGRDTRPLDRCPAGGAHCHRRHPPGAWTARSLPLSVMGTAPGRPQSGLLPCLRGARRSRLLRRAEKQRATVRRVSEGSMTRST